MFSSERYLYKVNIIFWRDSDQNMSYIDIYKTSVRLEVQLSC